MLAVLREVLKLNQTDFSEIADCSASTVQAIELGRLNLSESLATKISVATNISRAWLLKNDLKASPVTESGRSFSKEEYVKAQANRKPWLVSESLASSIAMVFYARVRAVFSASMKRDFGDFRIVNYELNCALDQLEKRYGSDPILYPHFSDDDVARGKQSLAAQALVEADVAWIIKARNEQAEASHNPPPAPGSLKVTVDEDRFEKVMKTIKSSKKRRVD